MPLLVNLLALLNRLSRHCFTLVWSERKLPISAGQITSMTFSLLSASGLTIDTTSLTSAGMSTGSMKTSILPASIFDRSRMLLISPSRCRPALSIFCKSSIVVFVALVGGVLLQDFAVADDGVQRRTQLVAHVGEEVRFGLVGYFGGIARRGELCFVLFQFGDVGIDRDDTAASGFSLIDLNPAAVAAVLDVRAAGSPVVGAFVPQSRPPDRRRHP